MCYNMLSAIYHVLIAMPVFGFIDFGSTKLYNHFIDYKLSEISIMFAELFNRKTVNAENALLFGFMQRENEYVYETSILDNLFLLQIIISPEGNVDTKVIEKATNEEYTLYKTSAVGSFVGAVRDAVKEILIEISDKCFDIFKSAQTKEIISYVREKYGDELEFLWEKSPHNAIWRRKDTAKWYGAILTISKSKLGIDSEEKAEIINLHIQPEKMASLLKSGNYFPGWHMNKKSWFTIILDGSISTEEICRHIDESYLLAKK